MGRITGGEISYSETRKIADYENKSAKVTLSFGFDDGEDYDTIIAGIQEQARARVRDMLGMVPSVAAKPLAEPAKAKAPVEEPKPKAKPGRKPKAVVEVVEEPEEPEVEEVAEVVAEEPADADDLSDLEGDEETVIVEYSDSDLIEAVSKAKVRLGDEAGPKLRKLISKYATKIPLIKQDQRGDFLEKLKALK